jgi:hypothetical protein
VENQHAPAHDTAAEWRAVTDALNALGDSIARASAAPVDDDESRRRMRELSEGLASLAARLGTAAGTPVHSPSAAVPTAPPVVSTPVVEAPPVPTSSEAPPSVRDAFLLATEKFRAAENAERATVSSATIEAVTAAPAQAPLPIETAPAPATQPVSAEQVEAASVTGSFKAVIAGKVSSFIGAAANRVGVQLSGAEESAEEQPEPSIQEWLYPEGLPEAELQVDSELEPAPGMAEPAAAAQPESTAPAEAPESSGTPQPAVPAEPLSPEDVLRVAHERFKAERRSAVESANKAREFAAAHRKGKHPAQPAPPSDDTPPLW